MRQALRDAARPVADRLQDGLTKVACEETGATYKVRAVSTATTTDQALKDIANTANLPLEASVELPGPLPKALRCDRPPVPGATRADGKPLS